ncbi:tetratricopeptide repeat protein [Thiomicrospira microaerophila]|uniref:tetratricopeptide repeat protein n=1 Tax=Thiomicrospira microaerophila TaxID=406020 RepID=UPI0006978167|nr:tetratricopeptide repeat protein [Thiomicrospira microaerophila]
MSILLDALKKASIEKKRREDQENTQASKSSISAPGLAADLDHDSSSLLSQKPLFSLSLNDDPSGDQPPLKDTVSTKKTSAIFSDELLADEQKKDRPFQVVDEEPVSVINDGEVNPATISAVDSPQKESQIEVGTLGLALSKNEPASSPYQSSLDDLDALGHDEPTRSPPHAYALEPESLSPVDRPDHEEEVTQQADQPSTVPKAPLNLKPDTEHDVSRDEAKRVNKVLLSQSKSKTSHQTKGGQLVKRISFYMLITLIVFGALAYYGLITYRDLNTAHRQDVQQLSAIVDNPVPNDLPTAVEEDGQTTPSDPVNKRQTALDVQVDGDSLSSKEPSIETVDISKSTPKGEPTKIDSKALPEPASKPASGPIIRVEKEASRSFADLAYEAYLKGNMREAKEKYERHLDAQPHSKTARLGLAALAVHLGHFNEAIEHYQRVLSDDPQDSDALAGIAATLSHFNGRLFSTEDLKVFIQRYPGIAGLHFALGNHYAQKQDWFLAQPAYFEAVKLESQNPDYRLNLAISFDQLGEYAEAIIHYKAALAVSEHKKIHFDPAVVGQRIIHLTRFMEQR